MKKVKLVGILALSIFGTQIPVSANVALQQESSVDTAVNYDSDEIYNNLSGAGKTVYIESKDSASDTVYTTMGLKKTVVTYVLQHGVPAMGRIIRYLNKDAEHYFIKPANLIADTLDSVSAGFRGAVVQALIKAGVLHSTASTIGWAVEKVLL